jgi:hypothetical protein
MMEGMWKRQFRVSYSPFQGYYVSEVHEGGFTSQIGRAYKTRESAERHLRVVLANHRPKYVPTYEAVKRGGTKS